MKVTVTALVVPSSMSLLVPLDCIVITPLEYEPDQVPPKLVVGEPVVIVVLVNEDGKVMVM